MYKEISTPQLQAAVENLIAKIQAPEPGTPGLVFKPAIEECDGPGHRIALRYHTYPWMANYSGVVHGGMVATLLDNSMGIACRSIYGACRHIVTPTVSLAVNYARPVPIMADIVVEVRAVTTGATSMQMTAEIYLPERPNAVLATSVGIYHTVAAASAGLSDMV